MANVAKKLATLVGKGSKSPTTYTGTVVSVGGRYRVLLDGATEPTLCMPEVKAITGDRVTVEVRNHVATVKGNMSHPAANDEEALTQASIAADAATQAQTDAGTAAQAATAAQQSATTAAGAATTAQASAASAQQSATSAAANAATANQAANTALVNLAVIEDVAGTLAWISEHGSYVLTTDTTVQDGTVYFELVSGDYVPIATPDPSSNPSQEGWYVLDVTDSQSDYIMAHLAVTSAGLWVLPSGIDGADAQHSTGYKALLASSGMSIFDGSGMIVASYGSETVFYDCLGNAAANIVAKFGGQGARIGYESGTHVDVKSDGMSLTTPSTNESFSVGLGERAVRRSEWVSTAISSVPTDHTLQYTPQQGSVRVYMKVGNSSNPPQGEDSYSYSVSGKVVTITDQRLVGHEYDVIYTATDFIGLALTSGSRKTTTPIGICSSAFGRAVSASGEYSFAEGYSTTASGDRSHSEGWNTEASGDSSHAEGYYAKASGYAAHAGGYATIASGRAQTAIGRWNVEDTSDEYALIVGNGSGDSSRSNAFAVGWNGSLYANNHSGAIGETKTADATVNVLNNSGTAICSVVLDPGTWAIEGNVGFAENATGRRIIDLATGSGSVTDAVLRQTGESKQAVSGGITTSHTGWITTRSSRTTVYLNAYQNSGGALSVTGYIRAMRIQ